MSFAAGYLGAKRALRIFWERQPTEQKRGLFLLCASIGFFVALFTALFLLIAFDTARFKVMTGKQHIDSALDACAWKPESQTNDCRDVTLAQRHLEAIRFPSQEQDKARELATRISTQINERERRRSNDAYDIRTQNVAGTRHDSRRCARTQNGGGIVSFDEGSTWWPDDGLCGEELEKRAARTRAERDSEEKWKSFVPATIRVDTDINSSWLPDEQRTCLSSPGLDGVISTLTCDIDAKASHNISVQFWGSTKRGNSSSWKCVRKENLLENRFVCRALD